jgi:RND superfamily putative drug exporter
MREEWARTGDNTQAVASGLATTARVITAAAAIMVCVFGSFVIGDPLRILAVFGLGLAAAVLIDATVVRMVLVPAGMQLLGSANWWLPRWIERAIPHLAIEPKLDHHSAGRDPGPAADADKVPSGPKETASA